MAIEVPTWVVWGAGAVAAALAVRQVGVWVGTHRAADAGYRSLGSPHEWASDRADHEARQGTLWRVFRTFF